MRIAILGSGGVGGYYGALLARAGHDVTFLARGKHLAAIRERGLCIQSVHGDFEIRPVQATDDPAQVGTVDLALFAVKSYDLQAMAESARPVFGPHTVALPLLSGLDAAQKALDVIGNNISNAATEGYHRQRINLSPAYSSQLGSVILGGGGSKREGRKGPGRKLGRKVAA